MTTSPARLRKAVLPVAGLGTRVLPGTKTTPKELLNVVDRPILSYIVEEAREAGIEHIVFVTGRAKQAIEDYFDHQIELEAQLAAKGKTEILAAMNAELARAGEMSFTRQMQPKGLGHAVWCARDIIGREPFAVLLPDVIVDSQPGALKQLAQVYAETGGNVIGVEAVPLSETHKYGIVATRQSGGVPVLDYIVEKPAAGQAPSNLNNAGCFLLTSHIYPELQRSIEHSPQDEKYLTDAVSWFAGKGNDVAVITASGEFLDCGTVDGWLYANNRILGK